MDLDLVIFDLDNTIWDFETNSREALLELYDDVRRNHSLSHDFDFFHAEYVQINYRYWDNYEKGKITKQMLRYDRFYDAFSEVNFHDRKVIDGVADRYLEISPYKTRVFEGTYETLEYLRKNYKLAIITNGFNEVVEHKVKNCRLDQYFDHVQTSEDAGCLKPNKRIFELVLEQFNAKPGRTIMIGDNFDTDITGAQNAGIHTILFDPKDKHVNYTDLKITNLMQLTQLL